MKGNKTPLAIMLTDSHLKRGNESQIIDIFKQAFERAKALGLDKIFFLGDWFDSRKYQGLSTLKATIVILNMAEDEGIEIIAIPGNHDKPSYTSEDSYLDVFEKYPSLRLIRDYDHIDIGDVRFHLIPFFDEKETYATYLNKTKEYLSEGDNILLTHIAVNGVKNNDGSEMENVVSISDLTKMFTYTFVGHYHDYQELSDGKIIYIGSTHQHNFGEDKAKGSTVIHGDLTLVQEPFNTKEYNLVKIDLNEVPLEKVDELKEMYSGSKHQVRFKFSGTKEKLKGIDKKIFKEMGIDVKVNADDVDVDLSYADVVDFKGFNSGSIISEWDKFTTNKELSVDMASRGRERLVSLLIK